jgi:F-type H+-transporting ATPase subunit b
LVSIPIQFAAESGGGISSLGLNGQSFLFNLATFVIVLLILRKYAYPALVETLEKRRLTLEESLVQAKKTEEALARAEEKAEHILHEARNQADQAISDAGKQAKEIIAKAEAAAGEQAQRVIKDAEDQLAQERNKLRTEVLGRKIDDREDARLIEDSVKEVK